MDAIDTIQALSRRPGNANTHFAYDLQRPGGNVLSRVWRLYCTLAAKRRSRLALDELSTHLLNDIGLTESEARRESAVPFWR